MTRHLPLIFSIAGAISLACLTVHQSGLISDLRQDLTLTFQKLAKTEKALGEEMDKNEQLQQEISVLQDSVSLLNYRIENLNDKVSDLKRTIDRLNRTIQKKEDEVVALTTEINQLREKNVGSEKKIKALEQERDKMLIEMQKLDEIRSSAKAKKKETEQTVILEQENKQNLETEVEHKEEKMNQSQSTAPVKKERQNRMADIVTNTAVNFQKICLRNEEHSQDLKKIKAGGWRYTNIEFFLENPNSEVLINEEFLLQVYDLDNQRVVPLNERNPGFPDSEQGAIGYKFRYDGKPLSVSYFNSQKKEGANYEVRLFYFKEKMVYPLRNGIVQIVKGGEVVAPNHP